MKSEELTDDAVDYILSGLSSEGRLNDWEKNFIESIDDQWSHRRSLSDRQREVLGKIWDKY